MPSLSIIWLACRSVCHTCHNCDNSHTHVTLKSLARRGKDIRPGGTPPDTRPGVPGWKRPTRLSRHVTPPLSHVSQHLSHVTSFVTHATSCHVTFLFPSEHLSHVTSVTSPIYRDVTLVTKTCSVFSVSQCDKIVIDWFIVISQDLSQVCHSVTSQCVTNHLSVPKSSQHAVSQSFLYLSHHLSQLCHKKERLWQCCDKPPEVLPDHDEALRSKDVRKGQVFNLVYWKEKEPEILRFRAHFGDNPCKYFIYRLVRGAEGIRTPDL